MEHTSDQASGIYSGGHMISLQRRSRTGSTGFCSTHAETSSILQESIFFLLQIIFLVWIPRPHLLEHGFQSVMNHLKREIVSL